MTDNRQIIEKLEAILEKIDPVGDDMGLWRARIDAIDQILLLLLNERSRSANAIGHIKKQQNLPIYAPEREKIVLENVLNSNRGPLEDPAVRALFERIIDETRSLERRKYQNIEEPADKS